MDDMPQQPGQGDLTLGLTCPIYEDVDATLAQFVRLTRLGATTEGVCLDDTTPGTSLLLSSLCRTCNVLRIHGRRASAFRLARYAADHNELREDDKRMLVGTISLFAEGKLELAAVAALQPPARRTRQTRDHLDHLGNFSMYRACNISVESIDQTVNMHLQSLLLPVWPVEDRIRSIRPNTQSKEFRQKHAREVVIFTHDYLNHLIESKHIRLATDILCFVCSFFGQSPDLRTTIAFHYPNIQTGIEEALSCTTEPDEITDLLLTKLNAKEVLYLASQEEWALLPQQRSLMEEIRTLPDELKQLTRTLYARISSDAPPSDNEYLEFLERKWAKKRSAYVAGTASDIGELKLAPDVGPRIYKES